MLKKVNEFLTSKGLDVAGIGREELLAAFAQEMSAGLSGGESSLAMIPSFISIEREIKIDQPVVVLDAGGTNVRTAVVSVNKQGSVDIADFRKCAMPGTECELNRDQFFDAFADFVAPNLKQSSVIGFCFSYPAEVTPDGDARLLFWSKQIDVPSVVNTMIGAGLKESLKKRDCRNVKVIILNDTVATLLAGKSMEITRDYSAYVGYILGTGTNTAYIESNRNITKRSDLEPSGAMAINVESGGFNKIGQCRFDEILDQHTNDPGVYTFEKMISGAYLGSLGSVVLIEAARAGFFSDTAESRIMCWAGCNNKEWQPVSNKHLDDFCGNAADHDNPFMSLEFTQSDKKIIKALCTPVYERAAVLAAVNIASAVIKTGAGKNQLSPVCVNINGSTYYKTRTADFQNRVQLELKTLLDKHHIAYELIKLEDSPLIGAAVAGLMV